MLFQPLVEHRPRVIITTASLESVYVTVSAPGVGFETTTSVSRYQHAEIPLPTDVRISDTGVSIKTVIVTQPSSTIVSVHVIDNEYESGDGFLALPMSQLGNTFYIMSYVPFYHETDYNPAFICVSASEYGAMVQITSKSGQKTQFDLQPFESFRYDAGYYDDLTGTLVESSTPISVVSGVFTRVPHGASQGADGLLEQIPPVESWGQKFILAPFLGRSSGYIYKVLTGSKPATLQISHLLSQVDLEAGQWYEGDVKDDTVIRIDSDQPVMVFQYMKSNQEGDPYEPAVMMVPPMNSYDKSVVTFPVFDCTFADDFQYNIHVIIDCDYASDLKLDEDTSMSYWERLKTADNKMCVVRGRVSTGVHSVSHEKKSARFMVAVYGLHLVSSYAYPAGFKPGESKHRLYLAAP